MLHARPLAAGAAGFIVLALAMLALTLAWHIPMMLWDHLDLVPMYEAWQRGGLSGAGFWSIHHGSHMHTAAYAVLFATTALSGGQPWLDCVLSWALLVAYAAIVVRLAVLSFPQVPSRRRWLLCTGFLALYPGHLSNLQWGWQVAVFLCLVGVAVAIACLAAKALSWRYNAVAVVAAVVAYLSFATAVALIPVAFALIVLRGDRSPGQRLALALPWVLLGLLVWFQYQSTSVVQGASTAGVVVLVQYALNFLGAGVARFATDLAPWIALIGLGTGLWAFVHVRGRQAALYWLGLLLFSAFSAVLTAIGRAGPFGVDQAFVTRYVSFSSLFWIGCIGLVVVALGDGDVKAARWRARLITAMMVLASANALHLMKQAARVAEQTNEVASEVRQTYPRMREQVLRDAYFNQSEVALERLETLHRLGFAPFDQSVQPVDTTLLEQR